MSAFRNPAFYKNLATGLSNFANSGYIYLGRDEGGYIRIPRGLLEDVTIKCEKAEIGRHIRDERCEGNTMPEPYLIWILMRKCTEKICWKQMRKSL